VDINDLSTRVLFARLLCAGLAVFDALLGGASLVAPKLVSRAFRPDVEPQDVSLLRRAGSIWSFFIPVQIWAAVKASPVSLRAVAILRLQEVPADPVWLTTGEDFGFFGKFGLIFAPIFNLVGGVFLWKVASDIEAEEECTEEIDILVVEPPA
jgi:hypothetical protein